jgi:S1-C subfamily serine protease
MTSPGPSDQRPSQSASSGETLLAFSNDLAAAVEHVGRSVVAIHARRRIPASGVHWRQGVVVASNHTIHRDDDITVTLGDGTSVGATLAGRDPGTDLAVLRLAGGSAPVAEIGDASALAVGQVVLAVGRPGDSGVTASLGIVSAVGGEWRSWHGGRIDRLVRLDLAIYDGFSGGPLVDASGRVLGINTSGLARGAAVAVPASTVNRVADQLLEKGRVARGYLGLGMQPVRLPAAQRQQVGAEGEGALLVVSLEPDGPADKAGVLLGDIILALDGTAVDEPGDVLALLGPERVGQQITARLVRGGSKTELPITVGERRQREG